MPLYAGVIVIKNTRQIDGIFTYSVPEALASSIDIGCKVLIPFGQGDNAADGIVDHLTNTCDLAPSRVKAIKSICDGAPWLSDRQLVLAKWIRERYVCSYSEALSPFLPPGTKLKRRVIEKIVNGQTLREEEVYTDIEDQEMGYIDSAMSTSALTAFLGTLSAKSIVKRRVLETIIKYGRVPEPVLRKETKATTPILQEFLDQGILKREYEEVLSLPELFEFEESHAFLELTDEQKLAFDQVAPAIVDGLNQSYLLKGVTGSGKTEVYMEWADLALQLGKQALILVPEISLTPQIIDRFRKRFGDCIAVFHSRLSNRQRYDQWKAVRSGQLNIVIGARSAAFAPIQNLGIVIVDEEHDGSYKSDTAPKYNGVDVALEMARIWSAPIVLGSATPGLLTYHKVQLGEYKELQLNKRFRETALPSVDVIDMREELQLGNRSIFSQALADAMTETLKSGKQVMLLMNRKGFSTFVSCRSCGYVMKCPDCEITLTYHKGQDHLRCNYCQYRVPLPRACPSCNSGYFKHFGTGTEKVEEMTKTLFPDWIVDRLDSETTSRKGGLESILEKFGKGETHILIGTQMISKGLDFKNVGLVGVISADLNLNLPDFQASERTFQLLTQVAGRAGRGAERGHVIIQTYEPDHFAILATTMHDFTGFFKEELKLREAFKYPPFCQIANVLISSTDEGETIKAAHTMANALKNALKSGLTADGTEVLGPNPAIYSKIKNRYRWQIIIKYKEEVGPSVLAALRSQCLEKVNRKSFSESLRVSVDARAQNIL